MTSISTTTSHDSTTSTSTVRTSTTELSPHLAYDIGLVCPTANPNRDEGEPRANLVRAALSHCKWQCLNTDEVVNVPTIFSRVVGGVNSNINIETLVMDPLVPTKPRVCLVEGAVKLLTPLEADKLSVQNYALRRRLIPIKGDRERGRLAELPSTTKPSAKMVSGYVIVYLSSACTLGPEVKLTLLQFGNELKLTTYCATTGTNVYGSVGISTELTRNLFTRAQTTPVPSLLPEKKGELPAGLMKELVHFWEHYIRFHVVASMCNAMVPNAMRPLACETVQLRRNATLRCVELCMQLHPSSANCVCAWATKLSTGSCTPTSSSRPTTNSRVLLTLSMCGDAISHLTKVCPNKHSAHVSNVGMSCAPRWCNAMLQASVACIHKTNTGDSHRKLYRGCLHMPAHVRSRARVLLMSAIECEQKMDAHIGKPGAEADLSRICAKEVRRMQQHMQSEQCADPRNTSNETLKQRDAMCSKLLQPDSKATAVCQYVSPSNNVMMLVHEGAHGRPTKLKGDESDLVYTHAALFMPPRRGKKRHR